MQIHSQHFTWGIYTLLNSTIFLAPTWSANFDVPMETAHGTNLDSVGSDVWSTEEQMPAKETGWASFSEFTSSLRYENIVLLQKLVNFLMYLFLPTI